MPEPNLPQQPPEKPAQTKDKSLDEPPLREEPWWLEGAKTIGLALFLAFGIRTFVAEARYIPSGSMEPTLQINDRLIVDKVTYHFQEPQRGDIIVFQPTTALKEEGYRDAFIKRIVALPGDRVAIQNGEVYINDRPLPEEYLPKGLQTVVSENTCSTLSGAHAFLAEPVTIPPNEYLALGDNRNNSYDGRCWGLVTKEDIIGRAIFRFWPLNRLGSISGLPASEGTGWMEPVSAYAFSPQALPTHLYLGQLAPTHPLA